MSALDFFQMLERKKSVEADRQCERVKIWFQTQKEECLALYCEMFLQF